MARMKATDYNGLDLLFQDKQTEIVTVGHNTLAERQSDSIVISLHGHRIVTLFRDGTFSFSMAGWATVTTRDRINQFLPDGYGVFQRDHRQYFHTPYGATEINEFDVYGPNLPIAKVSMVLEGSR